MKYICINTSPYIAKNFTINKIYDIDICPHPHTEGTAYTVIDDTSTRVIIHKYFHYYFISVDDFRNNQINIII